MEGLLPSKVRPFTLNSKCEGKEEKLSSFPSHFKFKVKFKKTKEPEEINIMF